jgi:hypothetical protein
MKRSPWTCFSGGLVLAVLGATTALPDDDIPELAAVMGAPGSDAVHALPLDQEDPGRPLYPANPQVDDRRAAGRLAPRDGWFERSQYTLEPSPYRFDAAAELEGGRFASTPVVDAPIEYSGPPLSTIEDVTSRDGPHIPEPMVFDLMRGLGARRGELEFNVLNLVPQRRGSLSTYQWAPEVEYAPFDGFAVEFELPIYRTRIEDLKFGAQYTIGTAFDDAFIHGLQGLMQYNLDRRRWTPVALYLAGLRFNKTWSAFGMFGFGVGPLVFPFEDLPPQTGTELIVNLSLFADITDDFVLGVETNTSQSLRGPSEFLVMPQMHWTASENIKVQFGYGMRDNGAKQFGELGFRVIFER